VIGYDALTAHHLEHPSVNTVFSNLWDVVYLLFQTILNDDLLRVVQNGSVRD
jgi:hypothetical protein